MILVDTSIWIELLLYPDRTQSGLSKVQDFVTCGPIVHELLQGFSDHSKLTVFRTRLLSFPRLSDPVGIDLFIKASDIYREGRRRGYTIRSPYDCLIATIAIEHDVILWHRDRDYSAIAQYTPLRVFSERIH